MNCISKKILELILSKPAPESIPRTGERADSVDCNVIYVRTKDESWSMLIDAANEKGLRGKKWQSGKVEQVASIPYDKLDDPNVYFDINHFYKIYDFKFNSLTEYFFKAILPFNKCLILLEKVGIFVANRKRLVRSERMETLQLILEKSIEDPKYKVSAVSLMSLLHSQKWVYHPDKDRQITYNNLLLKSLKNSGDLKYEDGSYQITESALNTLSDYELESKKHKQMLTQSKAITFLTVVLIIVGLTQAYIAYIKG
ncbi:hypothetical protein RZY40_002100 [Vibrio alginolyticus]|nr:hypothetical protein [Vibrio alginolyticus]